MRKHAIAAILTFLLLLSIGWSNSVNAQSPAGPQDYSNDVVLVKFLPGTSESSARSVHQRLGGKILDTIPGIDVQVVGVAQNSVKEKIEAYRADARVAYAEPDYMAKAILTPNDTYFPLQWGLEKIEAPKAWDITMGTPAIKIAICDTGIDVNHEDIAAKVVENKNFSTSWTVDDMFGHGTHVAGIAAAITNNGRGVAGTGYSSSLMNLKVLDDNGNGNYSWVANGIIWAANRGAKVINLSLGGNSPSETLRSAVDYAWNRGCIVVAASGNSNTSSFLYPAYYGNSIAVAATDPNDAKAGFSSYGSWVDVAAPGVQIFSTVPNHINKVGAINYGYLSGTSMSTPYVAGLAALVWATDYGTSNTAVRSRIENMADQAGTMWSIYGIKRINAYKAVAGAEPLPPDDAIGPVTSNINANPNPTNGAASVVLRADISDLNTGGSNIAGAEYFIDSFYGDGRGWPMSASDGAFNSPYETVTATIDVTNLALGSHTVYVHGQDDKGNWGITGLLKLNKTEKPVGNSNDIYVWSIDFRSIGWGWWTSWLFVDITIRHDSNANGIADLTDALVPGASVDIVITNQSTGQVITAKGVKTSVNGVATYYIYNPARGRYIAQVSGLSHAMYSWNKALDKENPSDPYILVASDFTQKVSAYLSDSRR